MNIVGYIVQKSNESDYTIYNGFMKLHRTFRSAFEKATEEYRSYLEGLNDPRNEVFEVHSPSQKQCDEQGSVVVFESEGLLIWIDCVVE